MDACFLFVKNIRHVKVSAHIWFRNVFIMHVFPNLGWRRVGELRCIVRSKWERPQKSSNYTWIGWYKILQKMENASSMLPHRRYNWTHDVGTEATCELNESASCYCYFEPWYWSFYFQENLFHRNPCCRDSFIMITL